MAGERILHAKEERRPASGRTGDTVDYPFLILVLLLLACLPITWRQEASLRIREHCPEGLLGRLGYYLVSNIWGGSYLLAFLLLAIVSAVSLGCQWKEMIKLFPFLPLLNTIGYVLFYAALIQCLHRRFGHLLCLHRLRRRLDGS